MQGVSASPNVFRGKQVRLMSRRSPIVSSIQRFFALVVPILLAGCATYRTPGGPVSIPGITDSGIAEALARKPAILLLG